ncbi:MAG: nucleoside deaminase [Deltaproteobacteria bacterium]|nr:nucleoside deaminase [Deltaproteobacteria bacterium]
MLMLEALKEAMAAELQGEVPAGALVVSPNGDVLGRGQNRVISLSDPTAHAEMEAIRSAATRKGNYRLTGEVLISTLEPCPMCLMAAVHARISIVVFGAPEPKWGAAGSLFDLVSLPGLNHRPEIWGGVRASECAKIVQEFFLKKRAGKPEQPD